MPVPSRQPDAPWPAPTPAPVPAPSTTRHKKPRDRQVQVDTLGHPSLRKMSARDRSQDIITDESQIGACPVSRSSPLQRAWRPQAARPPADTPHRAGDDRLSNLFFQRRLLVFPHYQYLHTSASIRKSSLCVLPSPSPITHRRNHCSPHREQPSTATDTNESC